MDIIKLFDGGFPLTIERILFLQDSLKKTVKQLSNIAGKGNMILDGVKLSGTKISDGVLIIDGEPIEFIGGDFNSRIAIFEEEYKVPYNIDEDNDGNLDLKKSDIKRTAKCSATGGVSSIDYDSLKRVGSLQMNQFPIGSIIPFDGDINNIPNGWELYDMADTFIIGAGGQLSLNSKGGDNKSKIEVKNLPTHLLIGDSNEAGEHSHEYQDTYHLEKHSSPNDVLNGYTSDYVGQNFKGSGSTDSDNSHMWQRRSFVKVEGKHSHLVALDLGGSDIPLDNRPKFKALNFIRFVGY